MTSIHTKKTYNSRKNFKGRFYYFNVYKEILLGIYLSVMLRSIIQRKCKNNLAKLKDCILKSCTAKIRSQILAISIF